VGRLAALGLALVVLAACAPQAAIDAVDEGAETATDPAGAAADAPVATEAPATAAGDQSADAQQGEEQPSETASRSSRPAAAPRPAWLGTRVLPRRPDGYGEIRPTPRILRNRRLVTEDLLPPPASGRFASQVRPVPADVARRSTWSPQCPVTLDDLRYVTVSFWGFDDRPHTGELLVHRDAARDLVAVFRQIYRARFPIEEMRIVTPADLDAPPTGDGNNTTAFVCRPSRGTTSWSQHAYGLAVDINPFHNPYAKGDVVLPELASAYVNRDRHRPGMIQPGDQVVTAFAQIGWAWGGSWSSLKDWMHFSANGR